MCGIAGAVSGGRLEPLWDLVTPMAGMLVHRGPDDEGMVGIGPDGRWVTRSGQDLGGSTAPDRWQGATVLANRRLAILDLTRTGHQPMISRDGKLALTYNGEVYNYLELRAELEALGHRFRSSGDTEVVLAALSEWGREAFRRFVGMFACAAVDRDRGEVTLARDRFGMKPLFYGHRDGTLVFASEMGALLATGISRQANEERVAAYLDRGVTDVGSHTVLAEVRTVPAGHWMAFTAGDPRSPTVRSWWTPRVDRGRGSFASAAAQLRERFLDSVRLHLRSDVPIGVTLSGGVDSSAVVMAIHHLQPDRELHTFSYIPRDRVINERPWIDVVNQASGAIAHHVDVDRVRALAQFAGTVRAQGQPFGSMAVVVQREVFRHAADLGIRVVMDGQGGDEMLGGYRSLWVTALAEAMGGHRWTDAARLMRGIAKSRHPREPTATGTLLRALRLLSRSRRDSIPAAWRPEGLSRVGEVLWSGLRAGSLPALLRYGDRNAMGVSVEARLPFVHAELAECMLGLPSEYIVGPDGIGKALFRAAMRGIVPDAILDRREKVGFSVPNQAWLAGNPEAIRWLEQSREIGCVPAERINRWLRVLDRDRQLSLRQTFTAWRVIGMVSWAEAMGVSLT